MPPAELPGSFSEMLRSGQIFVALILATTFSEKYQGRNMWPDQPDDVVFKEDGGDRIRFMLRGGQLLRFANGQLRCGRDDSTGVITKLTWSTGNRIVDQYDCGCVCPGHIVGSLRYMADKAGIPHNLPTSEEICAALKLTEEASSSVAVELPGSGVVWKQTLLGRYGYEEATPFIWLGDVSAGDRTLYVAFGPLRQGRQALKVCCRGSALELDRWGDATIWISSYVKTKLDTLWDRRHYDFCTRLEEFASKTSSVTDRILFCGISHGAVLAQAAALRFALCSQEHRRKVHVVNWNAYKWTDQAGSDLAWDVFSEGEGSASRCLPFILSKEIQSCCCVRRRYDSVPEHPAGFMPMRNSILLDVDAGTLWSNVYLGEVNAGLDFCVRAMDVHFAKEAIRGVKAAMARTHSGEPTESV